LLTFTVILFTHDGRPVQDTLACPAALIAVGRSIFCAEDHTDPSAVNKTFPADPTDVRFVPPLAMGKAPVTPVVKGRPVAFVRVAEAGMPRAVAFPDASN
jgi:hypothetical protein